MVIKVLSSQFSVLSFWLFALCPSLFALEQSDYFRIETYDLPAGVNFEASGLAVTDKGRLAVGLRKGEVWIEGEKGFRLFASGLHEILGLAFHEGALYATQRAEVTKLRDTDGDGKADEYLTAASGWGVSGAYHEYAYGPVFDAEGNLYTSLNSSMGKPLVKGDTLWRGWVVRTTPQGKLEPWCAGFRSPCGIGTNFEGDVFISDQQGNWMPTTPVFHAKKRRLLQPRRLDPRCHATRFAGENPAEAARWHHRGRSDEKSARLLPARGLAAVCENGPERHRHRL
jgi:hypothetical protein